MIHRNEYLSIKKDEVELNLNMADCNNVACMIIDYMASDAHKWLSMNLEEDYKPEQSHLTELRSRISQRFNELDELYSVLGKHRKEND